MQQRLKMEMRFSSEIYHVKQIVKRVLAFLKTNIPDLTSEDQMDLRLVFSELLYNAIVHGNKSDINKSVQLKVEIVDGMIYALIADEGVGFDYLRLLARIREDDNLASEGGRGIRLVYSLTDQIAFNVNGNAIHFYKKVASHG
ncbi:MAG: ATP-binding protein [Clostridiales bacterium]|nr:ATP-binding protein [Clostridiales bacterium]